MNAIVTPRPQPILESHPSPREAYSGPARSGGAMASLTASVAVRLMAEMMKKGMLGVPRAAQASLLPFSAETQVKQYPAENRIGELRDELLARKEQNRELVKLLGALQRQVGELKGEVAQLRQQAEERPPPLPPLGRPKAGAQAPVPAPKIPLPPIVEQAPADPLARHRPVPEPAVALSPPAIPLPPIPAPKVPLPPIPAKVDAQPTKHDAVFQWKEEYAGRDGQAVRLEDINQLMRGEGAIKDKIAALKDWFGDERVGGSDSGGHGNLIIVKGTPICIKFGEKPGKGTETPKYEIGVAFRKLHESWQDFRATEDGRNYTVGKYVDDASRGRLPVDKSVIGNLETLMAGDRRYTASAIARYLESVEKNGPSDDMKAYDVGSYRGDDGSAETFVIMKSAFFDDRGNAVKGSDIEVKAGNILAAELEASVNGGKSGRSKNARVIGGLTSIWGGVKAFFAGDSLARHPDGKHIHVISKKEVRSLHGDKPLTTGGGKNAYGRDAAWKTDVIVKDRLEKLSDVQLATLKDSVEKKRAHTEASGDAYIGSGYMIVVPDGADQMPTLTHIDFAHWLPENPPASLDQPGKEKRLSEYRSVHAEVLEGNIKALDELLAAIRTQERERRRDG